MGPKIDISPFSSFISTISQKTDDSGSESPPTQFVISDLKNAKELPSLGHDVRQKQRTSVDVPPAEVKVSVSPQPLLLTQTKTLKDFQEDIEKAKLTGEWKIVYDFYSTTFDSFLEINATFKKCMDGPFNSIEDCGVDAKFVNEVYDTLFSAPQDIQKCVLKGVINGLLQEWKGPRTKDDLRAYFILLQVDMYGLFNFIQVFNLFQNPLFSNTSTYVIHAHLLRQIAALTEGDHHFLIHWFKKMSQKRFKQVIERLLQFISLRLFPAKPEELPLMEKCTWWIPSAAKVLSLFSRFSQVNYFLKIELSYVIDILEKWLPFSHASFSHGSQNASNSLVNPPVIPYTDFYNSTLDHIDLMEEYHNWQCYGNSHRFSFCQYPFIISIAAKKIIIQKDSEQQMINIARQSLVDKVSRRQRPDMNMLFLNVKVRRMHLVSDSLDEPSTPLIVGPSSSVPKPPSSRGVVAAVPTTLLQEPQVVLDSESKGELRDDLPLNFNVKKMFYSAGMFTYHKDSHCHWFSSLNCDNYSEFRLVGALMGLAVYNSITLDIRFPPCCYKKLLSPPIVPCDQNTPVGISSVTIEDLFQVMPELAHGLNELLSYEGNVEEDFYSTFQVFQEEFGVIKCYNLKPSGDKIPVTNQNRKEYVQLYVDFLLNKSIYKQFAAFYYGFHSVCASYALMLLRPEEVEILVCGSPELDMHALQKHTQYDGYQKTDVTIRYFWEVVLEFPLELQKKLLHFATGSDRVPVGGLADLNFKISKSEASTNWLPVAHTCFNQLCLPPYKTKKELKQKLTIGISNAEGFGLE
ncbi:hypothetical protein JD844_006529 [Phrynosoma platyrhinos]|uniref:HECT-type E3 ubiquitin transferase n=1 Tax=Phrynosoma platyrhinos TaxID=52577 RepID=A0ABQ7T2W4_PHRPL|nr:hypothetical protein JD844_006529 [Phrynosoma platyrhinos]